MKRLPNRKYQLSDGRIIDEDDPNLMINPDANQMIYPAIGSIMIGKEKSPYKTYSEYLKEKKAAEEKAKLESRISALEKQATWRARLIAFCPNLPGRLAGIGALENARLVYGNDAGLIVFDVPAKGGASTVGTLLDEWGMSRESWKEIASMVRGKDGPFKPDALRKGAQRGSGDVSRFHSALKEYMD